MDTIAVTAAMPITTPRIVSPARILFLFKAAIAMRNVFNGDKPNKLPSGSLLHGFPGAWARSASTPPVDHLFDLSSLHGAVYMESPRNSNRRMRLVENSLQKTHFPCNPPTNEKLTDSSRLANCLSIAGVSPYGWIVFHGTL